MNEKQPHCGCFLHVEKNYVIASPYEDQRRWRG